MDGSDGFDVGVAGIPAGWIGGKGLGPTLAPVNFTVRPGFIFCPSRASAPSSHRLKLI